MAYHDLKDFMNYASRQTVEELFNDGDLYGQVDNAGGYPVGSVYVNITGVDDVRAGDIVVFGNHNTRYVVVDYVAPIMTLSKGLTVSVLNGETFRLLGRISVDIYLLCVDYADGVINAAIERLYEVPLEVVPPIIKGLSIRLTLFEAKRRRGILTEADVTTNKLDLDQLTDISTGKIKLTDVKRSSKVSLMRINTVSKPSDIDLGRGKEFPESKISKYL